MTPDLSDINEHIGDLERAVTLLLGEVSRLRRDLHGGIAAIRPPDGPTVDVEVLTQLVDQLGGNAAARAVVQSYIDALPGRLISVCASQEQTCAATTALRLASDLVGATALATWCVDRHGEPPVAATVEQLDRWLQGLGDDDLHAMMNRWAPTN